MDAYTIIFLIDLYVSWRLAAAYRRKHPEEVRRRGFRQDLGAAHYLMGRGSMSEYSGFLLGDALFNSCSMVSWFVTLAAIEVIAVYIFRIVLGF